MSCPYGDRDDGELRPPWSDVYMTFAWKLSERSTCLRAQVGCVVTSWDHNRVLAVGYNGNYRNGPNVCDSDEPGKCGCIHSETNALVKLDFNDPVRKRMYVTTSPCVSCAKLIINAGIEQVTYSNAYRILDGVRLLGNNGIEVIQI